MMKTLNKIKNILPQNIRTKLRLLFYKGTKFKCPLCGYQARTFIKMGGSSSVIVQNKIIPMGIRRAKCASCFSSDKERLLYLYLKNKLHVFENAENLKILHFAPEPNLTRRMLGANFNEYVCGDLFPENYPKHVVKIDVLNIPYPRNYFDVIICSHVLEHVPQDIEAMKEIYRVVKPKGHSILQVPLSSKLAKTYEDFSIVDSQRRLKAFGQSDHVRIYGQDYVDRLETAGFSVERINISKEYVHFGVNKNEDIFIGIKDSH